VVLVAVELDDQPRAREVDVDLEAFDLGVDVGVAEPVLSADGEEVVLEV
jgi:hypothetical protein